MTEIRLKNFVLGGNSPFFLIAGPCVMENEKITREIASFLYDLTDDLGIPFIFKASYDKANRTSVKSYRGPGLAHGLDILRGIKEDLDIPVLSDVHRFEEIEQAAAVLDIIQIPAFLCRQTDFVIEVARTGRIVNIKKGQFLAPWDIENVIEKMLTVENEQIMITERGVSFGYNNLVTDFRGIPIIRKMGYPVIYDATHSVQLPGGLGEASAGQREMAPFLARGAVAVGVDGLFLEIHPDPEKALCDGPNSLSFDSLTHILPLLMQIDSLTKKELIGQDKSR